MTSAAISWASMLEAERAAMAALPADAFDFVAGGSGGERTLRANVGAFDRCAVVPRVLRDVSHPDLATVLFGTPASMPVAIAPMAFQGAIHPGGEPALAAAARDAGVPFTAATLSGVPIEEIAATGADTWFQLYWLRDRGVTAELVARADAAGCGVLMLTVDVPAMGRRLRDVRSGFTLPAEVRPANLRAPDDAARTRRTGRSPLAEHAAVTIDPSLDWSAVEWLRARTSARLVLKGVLDPRDARRAADLGVDGLVVSNHGGRQLDGAVASLTALAAVREAVGDRCQLLLDGGVRDGGDVLKALALGASGVLLGRPALWGLAAGGRDGAAAVLALLRTELENALALAGCPDLAAAGRLTAEVFPC
ncbi:alpha-hydroxy acid oxidase [Acrocarpospora catenulata]|uniref:alpha-hydroxy acid oxidase n=1 Tax=Acrocarpospora catenulata TaxID=2836182 RepID=UPI002023B0EB|nr:alpha-hydroxy acid oxidase [Acrocarpospora catenulata]